MFEKEAEEYAKENKEVYGSDEYADITDYNNIKQAFLDGAEFGFDNAKNKMEKHIAELEQINAELKTVKIPQLERKIASIRGAHSVDCKKLNARLEQCERQKECIAELEKENAELKERLEIEQNAKGDWFRKSVTKDRQLNEVKELLRKFLEETIIEETCVAESEAEQFLEE